MFNPREVPRHQRLVESEYERALIHLKGEMIETEEYKKTLSLVERLNALMDKSKPSTVSKDTMLMAATNIIGIIMIISHEQVGHVVTSKALGFILRPR